MNNLDKKPMFEVIGLAPEQNKKLTEAIVKKMAEYNKDQNKGEIKLLGT